MEQEIKIWKEVKNSVEFKTDFNICGCNIDRGEFMMLLFDHKLKQLRNSQSYSTATKGEKE